MEIRYREVPDSISGTNYWGGAPTAFNRQVKREYQRTLSHETMWPVLRPYWDTGLLRNSSYDDTWNWWVHHHDWGAAFVTERSTVDSNIHVFKATGKYSTLPYGHDQVGPVLLAGWEVPAPLYTEYENTQRSQIDFGLGGTAIARTRPGKPLIDLATTIGELRSEGLPRMFGSMMARAQTVRDVFRQGGNEYLNAQFGWAPLMRDITTLATSARATREILERKEREVTRLIRRRYHFRDDIETVQSTPASHELSTTGPSVPLFSVRHSVVTPVEITHTVTKSYFSGGFRFFYPDYPKAYAALAEIEDKANALLGTRLDPEVLWNLHPWTWLADWFFNTGDLLGNLSALTVDNLVMQYGYIMSETTQTREVTYPAIWQRTGTSTWARASGPLTNTMVKHRKMRSKASPFGFGLNPDSFTESQWAILGALGMSHGLKK